MTADAFSNCHPAVNFLFFVGAIGFGVLIQHPAYLIAGAIGAAVYYLLLSGRAVYLTHGHVINKAHPLPFAKGDILLHGHTHVPACEDCGDFTYLNPGSVSIPKENSPHSYMIYEDGVFSWKNLETGETYRTFSIS